MLTKLIVRNFKLLDDVEIDLGNRVVFIGPNNSGKTSALQGLALWETGLKRWNEKRAGKKTPDKRPGVTINRRDLISAPVPDANLLWRNLNIRNTNTIEGKPQIQNVRIEIIVEGFTEGNSWRCGFEFDYANSESFYCRPLRNPTGSNPERMPVPEQIGNTEVAFLPPMSGLLSNETHLDRGAINVRIGEGRTAEVLRNLCYQISEESNGKWDELTEHINRLFGSQLDRPQYVQERGEISMTYRERGNTLDLSSTGRGMQQTMLLLAWLYARPGTVLLLDEPDAHLEILRQRQIYQLLTEVADKNDNQIIAASHSEILLNEAADRDIVVAFVGKPHRIDDKGSQVQKALREIGYDQYYLAEQTGWVLYLEGSTDLAILRAFAKKLQHEEAVNFLEQPFVHYVGNQPKEVLRHLHGLREAMPDLEAVAIFDQLESDPPNELDGICLTWSRREIENYLCSRATLETYAQAIPEEPSPGPLLIDIIEQAQETEKSRRLRVMQESIDKIETALKDLKKGSPWDKDSAVKVSDDFLDPLFNNYFEKLGLPNQMLKKNFYELVHYVPPEEIDPDIRKKLTAIVDVARSAPSVPGIK